ncbi:uncharacterized protein THITE_2124712 [Thermothielavioides terrestris NRRL 8126]|uniref:C3H1-type domain-containing protein n=1 Tax=Thermothielavioides terrestris (strain ATCC 38088 / NRRL 8126) TaxID=578455 RepID=G2RGB1_THETT|nr:uncharacterized protein THITE_2124712 [Thermothielavioides terrestris NRRL 8126]AEO71854.1 hypothetical protein THITE_2124712 [Thermothielavioides terrestris NRRL 8126]
MPRETCMIFIDDSNVWIEAQKFAASGNSHMPKLQDSDRDPRLRIDIGKLVERLLRNRTQGPSFLYGSRPPPNDSVWKAFEKNKFETNIYDRSYGGKEKEVDNSMSVDIATKATELSMEAKLLAKHGDPKATEKKDNTTFVVITGDRDLMPAVERVLQDKIRVELWGWKSGISRAYLDLAAANGLLSVHLLDSIFKDICFTAYRSTRKVKCVVGGKTMVLRNVDESREEAICDRLLRTGQLFWMTRWDGEADLCIEFPRARSIEKLIFQARQLLPDDTILSWPEYRARFSHKDPTDDVKTVNMYELLGPDFVAEDEHDGANVEERLQDLTLKNAIENARGSVSGNVSGNTNSNGSGYNNGNARANSSGDINSGKDAGDDSDGGGWQTVVNNNDPGKRHRRVVNQQQDCPYGLRCKKQDDCGYRHTDQERRLFRQNPNQNLGKRKTQMCRYAPNCWRGRDCPFAHTEAEARCLDCGQTGHFRGNAAKCLLRT